MTERRSRAELRVYQSLWATEMRREGVLARELWSETGASTH
jgi:hypothetical protein